MDCDDPAAKGTATEAITNLTQVDGVVTVTKKELPTVEAPETDGKATDFIDSVSQVKGAIVATKKSIPEAGPTTLGLVRINNSGGAAKYERVEELAAQITAIENNTVVREKQDEE